NLALVVGPLREDGKHEIATVLHRIELADELTLEPADELAVEGFPEDTLVRRALEAVAAAANVEPAWRVRIEKRIPVAAGLGGGSSDAAAALRLANATLSQPRPLYGRARSGRTFRSSSPRGRSSAPTTARRSNRSRCRATGRVSWSSRRTWRRSRPRPCMRALPTRRDSSGGVNGCSRRSRPATSRRYRRTTSPPRRLHASSADSAPSGPTSAAPARRSTGCSTIGGRPKRPRPPSQAAAARGSSPQRGSF